MGAAARSTAMVRMSSPRTPVPSVPTTITEVDVVPAPLRGVPQGLFVAPAAPDTGDAGARKGSPETAVVVVVDGARVPHAWLPASRLTGDAGEVHPVRGGAADPRWLVGVGATGEAGKPSQWRTAGAALVRAINSDLDRRHESGGRVARSVQLALPGGLAAECVREFVLGVRLGGYRFVVTGKPQPPQLRSVSLVVREDEVDAQRGVVARASELAAATALARDLANSPSNVKNPGWLASTAQRVAEGVPGIRAQVHDVAWLAEHGFGGMLAVGGGSVSPPHLIELAYRPRGATTHLLFVGKGITFDTGGISIKPAEGMHLMRTDMSGGAAVIGALRAIAALRLPVRVTALVPAAENHVSGSSYRPGDVLRHYGGRTSEIGNTDAEGRIVLADALAYGVKKFAPDVVVDVATLTGAMKVALGLRTGGLFATSGELADRIGRAGTRCGEAWWPMPLLDVHADAVKSDIADLKQTPAGPGGITAALFLREFTAGLPWAHLDIAGPARAEKTYDEVTPGGTGFGARTLVELAASYA